VRIHGKRARYAAELAEGAVGKPARRFVSDAKAFQDVIGEHQDAVVAEEWIRDWAASNPGAEDVVALLIGRERKRRARARRDWPGAWDRLERRARRARE
jgi:CHAD domain-containing protein